MTITIETHLDGSYWIDNGHADIGPFDSVLAASEHFLRIITDRANAMSGNNVYFLEGIAK